MPHVVGWGRAVRGQLGLDDEYRGSHAVPPSLAFRKLSEENTVVMVACGADFTILLLKSGDVFASGCNLAGQLGNSAVGAFSAKPVPALAGRDALKVACGAQHASAVTHTGEAFLWGLNDSGQLGLGHRKPCPQPVSLPPPNLLKTCDSFPQSENRPMLPMLTRSKSSMRFSLGDEASGIDGACVIEDADVLRRKVLHARGSWAEFVAGVEDRTWGWREIACGAQHTVATFRSHDQRELHVLAWGSGAAGCLGHGDHVDSSSPVEIDEVTRQQLDVIQVSAGANHSALMCRNSEVWTWGYCADNRLGLTTSSVAASQAQLRRLSLRLARGAPLSYSDLDVVAKLRPEKEKEQAWAGVLTLLRSGDALCSHDQAMLYARVEEALLEKEVCLAPGQFRSSVPRRVAALLGAPIVQVSCGSAHTVAVAANGEVWGWGSSCFGQLGRQRKSLEPQVIPALSHRDAIEAACGAHHTAVVTRTGAVLTIGMNLEIQCGSEGSLGQSKRKSPSRLRAFVDKVHGCTSVACGDAHTVVLSSSQEGPRAAAQEDNGEADALLLPPGVQLVPPTGLGKPPRLRYSRSLPTLVTRSREMESLSKGPETPQSMTRVRPSVAALRGRADPVTGGPDASFAGSISSWQDSGRSEASTSETASTLEWTQLDRLGLQNSNVYLSPELKRRHSFVLL
ncbi:hypothetical protein EMIHUDRAFT_246792 [Emiliania huxleyi CCMP1516]|uniref:Regulator of chromosome condensation n=2 Tax=Emiliania huxleyi TaxID=2903 RepID=A0A0D3IQT9_EMIH1|nr:hypothetical protein EMIHUDRAFT_246792 [Emiliania huxleyi CCMP1516]EOD13624.1 hypothetical protein EMIHUDRAFT_246792 [Emiliania huxleyi CCMP1516]|mmetsp:Transcript_3058/g.8966  ORF Transcript_3058/g.8966 Transcript_3058/m.8966 type:complete len:680 (+) Transcript_3058:42-2081(+)|eukprot:XP_005766053.1 hypothetical protein EMIHUDRAFT_246792 [Emiliania huxleyi CCMP1516]